MRSLALFALVGFMLNAAPATGAVVCDPDPMAIKPVAFAREINDPVNMGQLNLGDSGPIDGSPGVSVHLFVEFGPDASMGTPCTGEPDADGDETCGFDVTVEIDGDPYIVSFTAASAMGDVEFAPLTFNDPMNSKALHAVGVMAISPGPGSGAQYVGELVVNTLGPDGGTINVPPGSFAVKANLENCPITENPVAVVGMPEPDSTLMLILGMIALWGLHTLRTRRVRAPAQR